MKTEKFERTHIAKNFGRGNLGLFNIHSVANYQNVQGGRTLWRNRKNFEKSITKSKNMGRLIVSKKVQSGTLLLWNGFYFTLEALDAFKMKY